MRPKLWLMLNIVVVPGGCVDRTSRSRACGKYAVDNMHMLIPGKLYIHVCVCAHCPNIYTYTHTLTCTIYWRYIPLGALHTVRPDATQQAHRHIGFLIYNYEFGADRRSGAVRTANWMYARLCSGTQPFMRYRSAQTCIVMSTAYFTSPTYTYTARLLILISPMSEI